jgi:hypothetical protein
MTFFMCTDAEKTDRCAACEDTIGYYSDGCHFPGVIVCAECLDDFKPMYEEAYKAFIKDAVKDFASTRDRRIGIKAK